MGDNVILENTSIANYTALFSNKRPENFKDYNFSLLDNDTNMQYTNLTPEISTDFYNDLNLVDFKDFYYLNGYVYLRARLLSGNENTHLSIGIIDPISGKFNGALIYNKESDSSLVDGEFSTL